MSGFRQLKGKGCLKINWGNLFSLLFHSLCRVALIYRLQITVNGQYLHLSLS